MPQIQYRANLSSAIFPMTLAKAGRTVISPQTDQNYDKRIDPTGTDKSSVGIPQALYMENVIPTAEGFQSIGFGSPGVTIDPIAIGASTINCVEQLRLALNIEASSVVEDIDDLDTGDTIENWIASPNDTSGADYRHVEEATEVGDMPKYYKLTYDRNEHLPAYLYKKYTNSGVTENFSVSFDVRFHDTSGADGSPPDTLGQVEYKFLNSATGVGPYIYLANNANGGSGPIFQLGTGSAWSITFGGNVELVHETPSEFLFDTVYTVSLTMTKNPDLTYTIHANVVNTDTSTEIASLAYTGNFTGLGDYSGYVVEDPTHSDGDRFITDVTNTHLQATLPDTLFTLVSGIGNIDIAFLANNTVTWSNSEALSWEANASTLPGGFQSPADSTEFSTATVRGICYVCIAKVAGTKIYQVNVDGTNTLIFTDITTTIGATFSTTYTVNDIIGIGSSYNYLLLFTATVVFWSSTTTPTDFSASLVSGAGSETPGNLKGDITFLKEHLAGFYIYTTKNVLFAAYTGNSRYPWKFREVGDSGGYNYPMQVSGNTNNEIHYGINNAKFIQFLSPDSARLQAPEVTNFLEKTKRWDVLEPTTLTFSLSDYTLPITKTIGPHIWYVLNRYIIVPFGVNSDGQYTYAIIFDVLLQRYGRIKYSFDQVTCTDTKVFFIRYDDGSREIMYFDIFNQSTTVKHQGILILGKFQLSRPTMLQLEEIEIESVQGSIPSPSTGTTTFTLKILPSLDGKNFNAAVTPYTRTEDNTSILHRYYCHQTAQNHSIALQGAFDVNTILLTFHNNGGV